MLTWAIALPPVLFVELYFIMEAVVNLVKKMLLENIHTLFSIDIRLVK